MFTRLIAFCFLAAAALPASAGKYYRWVDDKGVTHYSEQIPPKVGATVVRTVEDQAPASRGTVDAAKEGNEEAAAAAQQDKDTLARVVAAQCTAARERLSALSGPGRVAKFNRDGNSMRNMTPEDRIAELESARTAVERFCGSRISAPASAQTETTIHEGGGK